MLRRGEKEGEGKGEGEGKEGKEGKGERDVLRRQVGAHSH